MSKNKLSPSNLTVEKLKSENFIYKKERWNLLDLINSLIKENESLKKNLCVPSLGCAIKTELYLEENYIFKKGNKK
jgi:hypothetical protein